jgi:hypothetical protein
VRALERDGYSVVDSYPLSQQVMAANNWNNLSPLWVGPADGHPNAAAHALIAQTLFERIVGDGLVDAPHGP